MNDPDLCYRQVTHRVRGGAPERDLYVCAAHISWAKHEIGGIVLVRELGHFDVTSGCRGPRSAKGAA